MTKYDKILYMRFDKNFIILNSIDYMYWKNSQLKTIFISDFFIYLNLLIKIYTIYLFSNQKFWIEGYVYID